ncbi:MAG: galactosyldiacylglycerol synthase [Opitutaceae bacterium]|nr:galactosyldiacylglycerol synthase [Opitutaceae bacterium]
MKPRVLILTAGFGEGHNAAARALAAAHEALHGAGTAEVADVFALAAPRLNELVRRSYLGLINRAPRLWSVAYAWLNRSPLAPRLMGLLRTETRVLARLIGQRRPDAICATYPAYGFMLAKLARAGRVDVPCFSVVTDSISINSLWWRAGAAGWFVPNEDSAAVMRAAGVDARRLHVAGFPVNPFFREHAGCLAPSDLGAGATPRVLYIINSGTRGAADTARRLIAETTWELTCTVGRDEKLHAELAALAARRPHPTAILGWTNEIPRLLMTHHVVISKAGGATTQEALAARCPMIVNQIVPGQEEGNYELLRRHGIGALAETPGAVLVELARAFRDHGRVWAQWRAALEPLSRPEAAHEISTAIAAHAAARSATEPVPLPLRAAPASA